MHEWVYIKKYMYILLNRITPVLWNQWDKKEENPNETK